jgi:hypothetical protein
MQLRGLSYSLQMKYSAILPKIESRATDLTFKEFTDFLSIGLLRYAFFDHRVQYLGALGGVVAALPCRWLGTELDDDFFESVQKIKKTLAEKRLNQYNFDICYLLTFLYKNLELKNLELNEISKAEELYVRLNDFDKTNRKATLELLKTCKFILAPPDYKPVPRPKNYEEIGTFLQNTEKLMKEMNESVLDSLPLDGLD